MKMWHSSPGGGDDLDANNIIDFPSSILIPAIYDFENQNQADFRAVGYFY